MAHRLSNPLTAVEVAVYQRPGFDNLDEILQQLWIRPNGIGPKMLQLTEGFSLCQTGHGIDGTPHAVNRFALLQGSQDKWVSVSLASE